MRILVADDHELMRKGIRSVLQTREDYEVCGEAVDGQDAVEEARLLTPDLIVMDVSMPRLNGLEATRIIRASLPQVNVVILSQHNSSEMMRQALNSGARGYVVKSSISADLMIAIDTVGRGQLFFDAMVSGSVQANVDVQEILQRSQAFERALRESEERFRMTFDQAAVGMAHVAPDGRWVRVNKKLCEIVGYSQREMQKLKFQDITHPDDVAADLNLAQRMINGEVDNYSMEKRYKRKDGRVVWINLTISAVRDAQGKLEYFISVTEDITERKLAEQRQEAASREHQALFELADEMNRAATMEALYEAAFNAIYKSLQCDRTSILLSDASGVMHFESWRGLSDEYRKVTDGHSAWKADDPDPQPVLVTDAENAGFSAELEAAVRKEGIAALGFIPLVASGKLIGKFMTYFNKPHEYTEHEIELSLTIARQLAFGVQRKRAEEATKRSEERLRLAQQAAQIGTWEWDPAEEVRMLSAELNRMFGTEPDDPKNLEVWSSRVHPEDWPRVQTLMSDGHREGKMDFEYRYKHPENGQRWFYCTGRRMGSESRMFGVILDITEQKKIEEERERNADELRAMVQATPECVKVVAADGTLLHMNAVGLGMIGAQSAEAVIGKSVYNLIDPKDRERFREFNERICRGEKGSLEFEIIGLNGQRRRMETHAAPLRQRDGSLSQLAVTRDITQRTTSERASGLLAAIVDSSDDAIVSKDVNGIITSWNKGAERLFGYTADEVIGKSILILIPKDRTDEETNILSRIRKGQRVDHFDTVRTRKDGTPVNISVTISPVKDHTGRVVGASKVARDITERKRAEERLRQITAEAVAAKAKFKAVFEQTTVFAGVMNNDGILLEANKLCLEVCGYTPDQVIGKSFWETPWWRNYPDAQKKIKEATALAAQGTPFRETLLYSWADGSEHIMDFALYPIRGPEGRVLFLHPTGVDITEQKRSEEKYRALAESLDAQVRARTRELEDRNAEILRQSEQLRELSWQLLRTQDEERRHIARELHDSAGQMLTVLGMNLSQLVEAARNKAFELVDSAEKTEELVQHLSNEIRTTSYLLHPPLLDETGLAAALPWYIQGLRERSGLEITLEIAPGFGRLPKDVELVIFRLVQECLTNIHRHSGSKTADIQIRREPDRVIVEVCDEGKGIGKERLAQIQLKGAGVGIRGMRERLREFGGELNIRTAATGTTVAVSIPVANGGEAELDAAKARELLARPPVPVD